MDMSGMSERSREAVLLLARLLLDCGKFADALTVLNGVQVLARDDMEAARGRLFALLRLGRYAEAEPLSAEVLAREAGRERAAAHFCRAQALWGCGKLDECRAEVDKYAAVLAETGRDVEDVRKDGRKRKRW